MNSLIARPVLHIEDIWIYLEHPAYDYMNRKRKTKKECEEG